MKKINLSTLFTAMLCAFALAFSNKSLANIYTVSSTADNGTGTLREAITNANANPGLDTIRFVILVAGNTFEANGVNTYAVIQLNTVLPVITDGVLIDGSSQTDTNLGTMAGRVVGVDSIVQAAIPYPDVWIVPSSSFSFPSNNTTYLGNGLTVNASNVTIRGICISGFGNTNNASSNSSHHGDVVVVRSSTERIANFILENCFLSSDPRGAQPALIGSNTRRRTKSGSFVVGGNNNVGAVRHNYMAYAGTYHIHFNGNFDHLSVGPANTTLTSRNWVVEENILLHNGQSPIVATGKAADAVNMMRCKQFRILENYIENSEQVGIDMGYNTDSNYVANNTITGLVNTTAAAPLVGIRAGLGSMADTVYKNTIYNNTGSTFKGGVWIDRSFVSGNTIVLQDNSYHLIQENLIFGNSASGVVISENLGTVAAQYNTISRNRIYNNTGLGIDLGFPSSSSPVSATAVTVNDDGDGDAGTNDYLNFPIIDSAKLNSSFLYIWGKAPTASTIEFFVKDKQINNHGGRALSYGEGASYIGTGIEGSVQDLANGLTSYNVDGNIANNNVSRFQFVIPYNNFVSTDSITATATLNRNTSEFGPKAIDLTILDCHLLRFGGTHVANSNQLSWTALCDKNFGYFVIEVSTDGQVFSAVQTIYATKMDSTNFSYAHPINGKQPRYYRLRMVSANGSSHYSQVIRLSAEASAQDFVLRCLQNPFTNYLTLEIEATTAVQAEITLVNAAGNAIANRQINLSVGANKVSFDSLNGLAKGWYQATVLVHGKRLTVAVVKE